jgi:hypothetical protein
MQVTGAVIREQGVTFAVVVVKAHVVSNSHEAQDAITGLSPVFGVPVVLMAQDSRGQQTFYGRPDLARFMSNVPVSAIPWRRYTIH